MRLWFALGTPLSVAAIHCTTVPLSPALAVNLKVELRSAIPFCTALMFVKFA